jgi:hypothetical protein
MYKKYISIRCLWIELVWHIPQFEYVNTTQFTQKMALTNYINRGLYIKSHVEFNIKGKQLTNIDTV